MIIGGFEGIKNCVLDLGVTVKKNKKIKFVYAVKWLDCNISFWLIKERWKLIKIVVFS